MDGECFSIGFGTEWGLWVGVVWECEGESEEAVFEDV